MVFEDPTRRRWRRVRIALIAAGVLVALLIADAAVSLTTSPRLAALPPDPTTDDASSYRQEIAEVRPVALPLATGRKPERGTALPAFARTAFVVQDDPQSVADLKQNLARLDAVFPDWLGVRDSRGTLGVRVDPQVAKLLESGTARLLPRLSNTDATGAWHGEILTDIFDDDAKITRLIDAMLAELRQVRADGVNIDFEEIEPSDKDNYLDFLQKLAAALHREHMLLTVDVPVDEEEAFDYEVIGQTADAVVVMGYDEHYPGGKPGPVASQPWFDDAIEDLAQRIPPSKLIAAIGAYGYDWDTDVKADARALTFQEAMDLAREHGAKVQTDKDAVNPTFGYHDAAGHRHQVWFLDAVTAWNQYLTARKFHIGGVSLWRLGMEEPAIWEFLARDNADAFDPAALQAVRLAPSVLFLGSGEILSVRQMASDGARALSFDGRKIDFASYDRLPAMYEVRKRGHSDGKKIALTFDDGPDPDWTPQLLDVLRRHRVTATFFLVGEQVQKFPNLVERELADGHLLGNHTYDHPNLATISDQRLRFELNLTQRMIESVTGRQTLLFRPPYDTDTAPAFVDQLRPLHTAGTLGYLCAGADVDSEDYDRPGVASIVSNVRRALKQSGSNIVVLHDAGGDRSQTVRAVDELIPLLKTEGYEFVTLADLLGAAPDQIMPRASPGERAIVASNGVLIWLSTWGWRVLMSIFLLTTTFALLRSVLLGILVYLQSRRPASAAGFTPPVLVLIPAYNEEMVIGRTIEAVLQCDYPQLRIMVVDDGSTDGTAALVTCRHRNVCLISKPNGGKHSALNRGFREADEDYVVTIDADTIILPDTIRRLVAHFADAKTDAVCGNVQVGNAASLLTRFQDVEYVTSQNYDRRAFDAANCIPVVPGATGAWRREAVLAVGGYSPDTLTEDTDLTLTLLRNGYRIVYEPNARSITEAPKDTASLFKQRFRWGYGTFQCLWKHRDQMGRGSLGWIALPNLLLFQVLFPVLAPLSLLIVIMSLARGQYWLPLAWCMVFVVVDLIGAAIAFALDGRTWLDLWLVLAQRLYYRPFMYVVTCRSVIAAIVGRRHGWNKLDRHGSVPLDRVILHPLAWDLPEQAASHPAA